MAATPSESHVYGPVPSRRLGRSLGIDLVPHKTCTFDCVYCQLGRTTHKTSERREYVPVAAVLTELERVLTLSPAPDYISLAGSGEPTLNSGMGRLVAGIKNLTDVPVAVISNGSLLWMEEVQQELLAADLVLPSLDAGDATMFARVNRPDRGLCFDLVVDGLVSFAARFPGEVWLEVMLLAGLNDTRAETEKIAALARDIAPTRIQLNTACRPPAERLARPVPRERMSELADLFAGEVICDFVSSDNGFRMAEESAEVEIMALLGRRPCTAEDVAAGLGLHVLDVLKRLDALLVQGRITRVDAGDTTFYALPGPVGRRRG